MSIAWVNAPAAFRPVGAESWRVETTTLLPGGSVVTVGVCAARGGFTVSDESCGWAALLALGVQDLTGWDQKRGGEIAKARGLGFDGQVFSIGAVEADQLAAAIAYVADACREWVSQALEARERAVERDFSANIVLHVRAALPGVQVDAARELQGHSTKRHRFDAVAVLGRERFALFEATRPVAASIAPTHLKFYDMMQAQPDWPRAAVIENFDAWAAADLTLLQPVCTHIRAMNESWADLARLRA